MATSIGIIGGTGPEGKGLAARFARAGFEVLVGSRSAERGEEAATEIRERASGNIRGVANADAAAAHVILVTVPYSGQADTLTALKDQLAGKIVISTVVPMAFEAGKVSMIPVEAGSAAEEMQLLLPDSKVVGAYQNLAARKLFDVEHRLDADVIVTANDREALREVIQLTERIPGLRGVNGGPLSCSHYVEAITTLLVHINRNYKTETTVKISGI